MIGQVEGAAAAGNTGLAVDNDVGLDNALLDHRGHSQDGAGGVAAGVGDQPGGRHVIAVQLGQAIDRFFQVGRVGVDHAVPLFVLVGPFQSKVGADVHNLDALFQDRNHRLGAGFVRQGREDQVQAPG